jgi:small-conductance mechanosensitive channel
MTRFLLALALALGCFVGGAAAQAPRPAPSAPPASPSALSRAQAQTALDVLRDDARRAQLITVLEAIVRATPQTGQPAAPRVNAAPTEAAAAPNALPIPLAPNSVGAQILTGISEHLSRVSADIMASAEAAADFPTLGSWLVQLATNPDRQQQVFDVGWRLLLVLAVGLLAEAAARRALRRPAAALERTAPDGNAVEPSPEEAGLADAEAGQTEKLRRRLPALLLLRQVPFALGHFLLDVLPVLLLLTVGYVIAGTALAGSYITKLVILDVLHATVACQLAIALMCLLVSPGAPRLRLLPMSDRRAAHLLRWTRRLAVLVVFGYAAAEIGLLFGLYRAAYEALLRLVSLAVLVCLVIIVLQTRAPVAERIRATDGHTGTLAALRNRIATRWHVIAIFYLVALWLVWAFDVPNGFSRLLRVAALTVVIAMLARWLAVAAYSALDRALRISPATLARHPGLEDRLRSYQPIGHAVLTIAIAGVAGVTLFQAWGVDAFSWFTSGALGGRIIGALGTIGITLAISLVVWEAVNAGIQFHLARLAREAQAARSARLRTLLPMLRTTLLVTIFSVAGLMVLSEIGVNTGPLLAGAGVIGLAIGFGSQKLVQDIITGLFLLLENTMQVGDVVSLGGLSGTVEALSIRSIRLRALDGSVHTVPFSAVTTVTNQTRDFDYAVVDVSVGLSEDPDQVADLVRAVARDVRQEPRWKNAIRDDIDVMGVEKFLDTALVLRTRIKTVPGQRWAVAREMNRRIKARFDELAIESPWTSYRVLSTTPPPPPASPRTE